MQAWYRSVVNNYALEAHHLKLLVLACQAFDRAEEARVILDAQGLTYTDRLNCPRSRPEVAIERDNRLAYAKLVRELGLDLAPEEARPPTRTGLRTR
jgi:hypothetical protein